MARRRAVLHRRRQARFGASPMPQPSPNGSVGGRAPQTTLAKGQPACCAATLTTSVMDGGTVLMLTRHTADCPVWVAR
ncbi:hypothetical protein [Streptomyces sp. NRRL S-350]|uniref:hypothetical protein n=1 Tax=Streptomyces sp. NRRL S-350 TaxID=1463902 RepID=UPI00131C63B7|nr:hypothetical protein [Streptomyces sp. NRRL S-350]